MAHQLINKNYQLIAQRQVRRIIRVDQPMYYQTLSGSKECLDQIQSNNYMGNLSVAFSNSNNYLRLNPKATKQKGYNMKGLFNMLAIRNQKYLRSGLNNSSQAIRYHDLPFSIANLANNNHITHQQYLKAGQGPKVAHTNNRQYNRKQLQSYLKCLQQQFCEFSLDSQLKISDSILKRQVSRFQHIKGVSKGLRKLNLQLIHRKQQIKNEFKQFDNQADRQKLQHIPDQDLVQRSGQKLVTYSGMLTQNFQELVRQVQIIKQYKTITKKQGALILKKIMTGFEHEQEQQWDINKKVIKMNYSLTNNSGNILSDQQRYRKIFQLFVKSNTNDRSFLNSYLFNNNQEALFQIIQQYDKFVGVPLSPNKTQDQQTYTLKQIKEYIAKINKWAQLKKQAYCKKLVSIMSYEGDLEICMGEVGMGLQKILEIGVRKCARWLDVRLNKKDQQQFKQIIFDSLVSVRKQLIEMVTNSQQTETRKQILYLKLLRYESSFPVTISQLQQNKIVLLLLICSQRHSFQQLFNLAYQVSQTDHQNQTKVPSQRICVQDFVDELSVQLKSKYLAIENLPFIIDCLIYVKQQDQIQILLSSKQFVEGIDWQHLCAIQPKEKVKRIMRSIILNSINIYQNTAIFLNSGIPIESFLPYFQIQILVEGLSRILTSDGITKLSQKDKGKFFGMISVFRGENLPIQYQFLMTMLEMMFQWYVLRQSIYSEDYKSIGLSLKSNLQQNISNESALLNNSARLTESSKGSTILRIHNYEYTKKIGKKQFIDQIIKKNEFQSLYICYMYTIAESICKIKQSKQKIIKRSKIQIWAEAYIARICSNIKMINGNFLKKMKDLRQKSLKIFSQHQI